MDRNSIKNYRDSERGSARVKFLLVALILIVCVNAAYNYIPVAYQGENFKQEMQTAILQGMSVPANGVNPVEAMKARLSRAAANNQLPPAVIDVKQANNVTTAHVSYSKEVSIVPFGIYNYRYEFDHTATPTGFLMKQ